MLIKLLRWLFRSEHMEDNIYNPVIGRNEPQNQELKPLYFEPQKSTKPIKTVKKEIKIPLPPSKTEDAKEKETADNPQDFPTVSEPSAPSTSFGCWPANIHYSQEQQKRIEKAKDGKYTPIVLDIDGEGAYFQGENREYATTLDSCQCIDFSKRKCPCKHMYRLAMELGVFPGIEECKHETIIPFSERVSVEEVLFRISDFSEDELTEFGYACYSCGNNNKGGPFKMSAVLAEKLYLLKYIVYSPSITPSLNVIRKDELLKLFGEKYELNNKMRKSDMLQILSPSLTIHDIPMQYRRPLIMLSPSIQSDAIKIHRAICKITQSDK